MTHERHMDEVRRDVCDPGTKEYWVLICDALGAERPFMLRSHGAEVLPLFSFEEEADFYLRYGVSDLTGEISRTEKRSRKSITELLSGGDSGRTDYIVLDPIPEICDGLDMLSLTLIPARHFLDGRT